jgi:hypothetical protein
MPDFRPAVSAARAEPSEHGPWNPGIGSELPAELLPLATILRPENVSTTVSQALELRAYTGLALEDLVVFRPERLAVHELLVRVTANLSVPDGPRQEDLGIHFRRMTHTIFEKHVKPRLPEIEREYETLRRRLAEVIDAELSATLCGSAPDASSPGRSTPRPGLLHVLAARLRHVARAPARSEDPWEREARILREWTARSQTAADPLERAACGALAKLVAAIRIRHPRTRLDKTLLTPLATGIACNEYGSEVIGALIDPVVRQAAAAEGYRLLPAQERPVVMNTKGASASGKSTMRPLQKKLAEEIGVDWDDFAVVSPDIWRKYLLDYDSLGSAYKYSGHLTGIELEIVDSKLDRYMAEKARCGRMSHLLIDRFRFDSFAPDSGEAGSNLLTRFGHLVYMFYMITPPDATVERAWRRGLELGRYKAVDDLLAHNVEAYTGMPELFFTWALRENKLVHYEFLDNSVALGERPRTIAFGWNGEMNIVDVKCMLDVDRYRKINVNARHPEEVYPDRQEMVPQNNVQFLRECVRRLAAVNFVERTTARIYARIERGALAWTDPEVLDRAIENEDTRAGLLAVAPAARSSAIAHRRGEVLRRERFHTLGQWGPD